MRLIFCLSGCFFPFDISLTGSAMTGVEDRLVYDNRGNSKLYSKLSYHILEKIDATGVIEILWVKASRALSRD
jgi:hypothetical protein